MVYSSGQIRHLISTLFRLCALLVGVLALLHITCLLSTTRFERQLRCGVMRLFCRPMLCSGGTSVFMCRCDGMLSILVIMYKVERRSRTFHFLRFRMLVLIFRPRLRSAVISIKTLSTKCTAERARRVRIALVHG